MIKYSENNRFRLIVIFTILLLPFLVSCNDFRDDIRGYGERKRTVMESKVTGPSCINRVYIEPQILLSYKKYVGVFQVKAALDAKTIATHMTNKLRDALLTKQTFQIVEANYEFFNSMYEYFEYARKLNYDYIVVSEISNIIDGGIHRQSMMTFKTRLIDPKKEVTLLYMENCVTADPSTFLSYYELKTAAMPAPSPVKLGEALVEKAATIIDNNASGMPIE